jgi:hypothetical protein
LKLSKLKHRNHKKRSKRKKKKRKKRRIKLNNNRNIGKKFLMSFRNKREREKISAINAKKNSLQLHLLFVNTVEDIFVEGMFLLKNMAVTSLLVRKLEKIVFIKS